MRLALLAVCALTGCSRAADDAPPAARRAPEEARIKPLDPLWQKPPWNKPHGVPPKPLPRAAELPPLQERDEGRVLGVRRTGRFEIHYHEARVKYYLVDPEGCPRLPPVLVVKARNRPGLGDVIRRPTLDDFYPN